MSAMTRKELDQIEYIFNAASSRKIGALRVRDDILNLIAEIKRLRRAKIGEKSA